jgi:trans-2-enoyl-CoA reductase
VASVAQLAPIHLGVDDHKDTVSVGNLVADQQVRDVERIAHEEVSVRRLVGRLADPRRLRACYEAGPTGVLLRRHTSTAGSAARVSHTYGQAGTYLVTLGITHDSGNSASAVNSVTATNSARFVRSRSARGLSRSGRGSKRSPTRNRPPNALLHP